ncbi:unnamed protein product, partial [marine sediment metagenome]
QSHRRSVGSGEGAGPPRRPLAIYMVSTAGAMLVAILLQIFCRTTNFGPAELRVAATGVLICTPLAWYGLVTGGWRGIGRLLPTAVPGVILMFAAFLPWMAYMQALFPEAANVFSEQVAERAAGTEGWAVASAHYYLLPLITLTLPWIGFLPGAFAAGWLKRFSGRRRELVYLFLWSAGLVVMLTVSAGKRDHYILP